VLGETVHDKRTPSKLLWCGAHMYISFRLWVQLWRSLPYSVLPRSLGKGCVEIKCQLDTTEVFIADLTQVCEENLIFTVTKHN